MSGCMKASGLTFTILPAGGVLLSKSAATLNPSTQQSRWFGSLVHVARSSTTAGLSFDVLVVGTKVAPGAPFAPHSMLLGGIRSARDKDAQSENARTLNES